MNCILRQVAEKVGEHVQNGWGMLMVAIKRRDLGIKFPLLGLTEEKEKRLF